MKKIRLQKHIEQIRGISYNPNDITETPIEEYVPILKANNIQDGKLDTSNLIYIHKQKVKPEQLIRKGDILIAASSGSKDIVGKSVFFDNDFNGSFGAFCKVIRPKENIYAKFVSVFFKTPEYKRHIRKVIQGANINNLRTEDIDSLLIPEFSTEDQHRIAAILSKAEALIAQRKQSITLLDDYLKSTFLDMFGDPVRNEKGWDMEFCDELFDMKLGKMLSAKNYTGVRLRQYLRNINVKWGEVDLSDLKEMDFSEKEQENYNLKKGDILVCEGGEVGRTAILNETLKDVCFQNAIHRLRIKNKNKIDARYFYWFMFIGVNAGLIKKETTSVTIQHFTQEKFKKLKIPIPPLPLQNQFAAKVQKVELLKKQYQQSLVQLQGLFGSLSQRAFKGELALDKVVVEEENEKPILVKNEEKDNSKTEDSLRWKLISEYKKKGLSYKEIGNHILDKPNLLFTKEDYFGMLYEKEPFEIVKKQIQFFLDDTAINFKEFISKKNIAERIQDAVRIQFYKYTKKHDIDIWLGKKCFKFYSEYILSNKSLDSLLIKKEFSQYTNAYNLFKNEYLNTIKNRIQDFIVADHSTLQNKSTLAELICKKCFYDILEFANTNDYIDFISLNIKKTFKQFQLSTKEEVNFLGAELFFDNRDFTLSYEGVLSVINIELKQQKYGISFRQIENKFKNVTKDYSFKKLKSLLFDLLEKKEIIQHYASKEWMQSMQNMQYSAHGGAEFVGDGSIWFLVPKNVAAK